MLIGLGVDVYQLGKTLVSRASPQYSSTRISALALSGHSYRTHQCPLWGVKRTWRLHREMSAYDPKRTCEPPLDHLVGVPGITAATPSGLMLKAKNVRGVSLGFPH
jgi:hypothetical protein